MENSSLKGLKWPKTSFKENGVIVQFPDVLKHRPRTGGCPDYYLANSP